MSASSCGILERAGLTALFGALTARGLAVIGPTVREGAITLGPLDGVADLPAGWGDTQEPGAYRLVARDDGNGDGAVFGHASTAGTWKRFLHPPDVRLFAAARGADGALSVTEGPPEAPAQAFLGVRACDVAAIAALDRVFLSGPFRDPIYAARREKAVIIAVNCGQAAQTCFCASVDGSGPHVKASHDIALTEFPDRFLVEAATPTGEAILAALPLTPATADHFAARDALVAATAAAQTRALPPGTAERLGRMLDQPQWSSVGDRCLSCGNCTLSCPTCFCATVEDSTGLDGATAERKRVWDSCFSLEFSYIHGGAVRDSTAARYRQWMTHKLSTWADQYGTSGCVGCGRCITWCPVGIDITAEAAAFAALDREA